MDGYQKIRKKNVHPSNNDIELSNMLISKDSEGNVLPKDEPSPHPHPTFSARRNTM